MVPVSLFRHHQAAELRPVGTNGKDGPGKNLGDSSAHRVIARFQNCLSLCNESPGIGGNNRRAAGGLIVDA
ncbi:MAG: hypothetical protein IKY42_07800, partial [Bacteroidaceae bacterium]|nr:hypothetical protein [Bacteroidaceae bacterium]